MASEELEFRISQYADGSLPADEVAALEAILASDAEAGALLEDFRKIEASLKRETALPAVNWDRLRARLSDAVAAEDERVSRVYRIGPWTRAAIAAMVLIAMGLFALHLRRPGEKVEIVETVPSHLQSGVIVAEVTGPASEATAQPAVAEISIGPSPLAQQLDYGSEEIVYQPPRVVIASGQSARQDNAYLPY